MPLVLPPLLNVAVTDASAFMVKVQAPVPVQAPLQPVNDDPEAAVWVRVTAVPGANDAEQVVPQLMPAGVLATVPLPLPAKVTRNWGCVWTKVTETFWLPFMVTEHPALPEQAP